MAPGRVSTIEARLQALESGLHAHGGAVEGHTQSLTELQRGVTSLVRGMSLFGAQALGGEESAVSGTLDVVGRVFAWVEIQTVMAWIRDAASVRNGPLVSVTIATRGRPELLRHAIASVLGQSYECLECIVVDDSDGPETASLVRAINDRRLRLVRTAERRGSAAAFNVGLEAVRGDLVTFLDDDNVMDRQWLRSIVWAFDQRPATDVLYGARVFEDIGAVNGNRTGGFPSFKFIRYDRRRHEQANFVDRNTIAVRASGLGLRYDESLPGMAVDWEFSLRLFAQSAPLPLPAVACYYRTLTPGRISDEPDLTGAVRAVRAGAHRARPLRVHLHRFACDPAVLCGDLKWLTDAGAQVSLSSGVPAPRPLADPDPWQVEADVAIAQAQPDLILLGSAREAAHELELLEKHGLPYGFREDSRIPADPADPIRSHRLWLGPITSAGELEPALREALTGWLLRRP
jgi:hypothetical protein